jgi:hypothetical protein
VWLEVADGSALFDRLGSGQSAGFAIGDERGSRVHDKTDQVQIIYAPGHGAVFEHSTHHHAKQVITKCGRWLGCAIEKSREEYTGEKNGKGKENQVEHQADGRGTNQLERTEAQIPVEENRGEEGRETGGYAAYPPFHDGNVGQKNHNEHGSDHIGIDDPGGAGEQATLARTLVSRSMKPAPRRNMSRSNFEEVT